MNQISPGLKSITYKIMWNYFVIFKELYINIIFSFHLVPSKYFIISDMNNNVDIDAFKTTLTTPQALFVFSVAEAI